MSKPVMTLGIFAHANAGKTTLTEQLLFHTNVKKVRGRVDHGDTTTDNLKIERERGISVKASMVTLPLEDRIVQLIDTPGHLDFSAEVERAISVLDGAILVVSGVEGVEPQTQTIWKTLKERNVPTLIFINKMDRVGADYNRVLAEMQTKLDPNILPMIRVIVDDNCNLTYQESKLEDIIEEIVTQDEKMLEKYLNAGQISKKWIEAVISETAQKGLLHFVYGGSALNDEGILKLVEGISKYLPISSREKNEEFTGYVYTIKREDGVRELYVKILSGTLENRHEFIIGDNRQKIRTMSKVQGSKKVKCEKLETGEIGIITGISARCGEIIGAPINGFSSASFVKPLFHTSVSTPSKQQITELVNALEILNDEDPSLNFEYDKMTSQINLDLMGELQSEVLTNILKERFGVEAIFSEPIIIHKETPINVGTGSCTFDRVSYVEFEVSPLPIGSGLVYKSNVSTDYLFSKYQKQIEKLVAMYSKQGIMGWEVTDATIVLNNGKSDSVCSDPSHFNVIVPLALMRAFKMAGMCLQEPIMKYEITTPNENFRQILAICSSLGVEYDRIVNRNLISIVPGNAPLSKIFNLPVLIARATSGHGNIVEKPNGYGLKQDSVIIEKKVIGSDPKNEALFLMAAGVSADHLDIGSRNR